MQRQWIFVLVAVSAMAADDANVKAFIPTLTPVKRVEAVYPDAAKQQNISGMVELFVTINPAGNVVAADAVQGQAVLRPAAIDAAKQWTFRPVLRDGNAVYAITTAMVTVGPSRSPARLEFNAQDATAYAQRLSALTKQFPRSPEQVLADNEQQTAGDSGIQRFYDLPRLAKAALKAGDMAKAQGYATELLALAPRYPKDWNYGNAIHDGNMVMGAVALQQNGPGAAVQYLLAAGKTPGSPQLGSFGPNMTLAKALIDAGQGTAVLQYFEECRAFWKMGGTKLDDWSAMVRGGGKPDFGANLLY
jgi:TonB family protein